MVLDTFSLFIIHAYHVHQIYPAKHVLNHNYSVILASRIQIFPTVTIANSKNIYQMEFAKILVITILYQITLIFVKYVLNIVSNVLKQICVIYVNN